MKLVAVLLAVSAGCQSNVKTPFPPGLEPLEDNPVVLAAVEEGLVTKTTDSPYVKIYGRGYVKRGMATAQRCDLRTQLRSRSRLRPAMSRAPRRHRT